MKKAIKKLIKAWESLPQGKHPPKVIADWLKNEMSPAINKLREEIKS